MTQNSTAGWTPTPQDIEVFFREQGEAFTRIEPLLPICPAWCTSAHDENQLLAVDKNDAGIEQVTRFHRKTVVLVPHAVTGIGCDDIEVGLEQMENTAADGTVARFPVVVALTNADGVDISGDTAHRLAAALMVARDELTELGR